MEKEDHPHFSFPNWIPIPEVFWSDLTKRPFENCIQCNSFLLEHGTIYIIEKALKASLDNQFQSTVFEYAMCLKCAESMQGKLSESSRKNISAYYQEHVDFSQRNHKLSGNMNINDWIDFCLIHKKRVSPGGEYQLYAQCDGPDIILGEFPFMIRGEALEELIQLISAETLEELDGFKNDLLDGPPELKELFDKGGVKVLL